MKGFIRWVGLLSWFSLPMFGQSSTPLTTTDHFTIEPVTVQPGGETVGFVVGVEGSRLYTAYNMEIELPEGVTLSKDEYGNQAVMSLDEGSINPVQQSAYGPMPMHLFSYLEQSTGNLRVACFSSTNADFTAESGNLFTVYVKASPYACPGEKQIRMFGLNLTVAENAQKYIPEGDENFGTITIGTEATVPVSIAAENAYGTCILPFDMVSLPDGVEAYRSAGISGDVLRLEQVVSLEAYTPYVLYAPNGYSGNWTGTVDASEYPAEGSVTMNGLTGVLTTKEVDEGFILQNQGSGARFYAVGDVAFSLPAGRCYLSDPAAANVNVLMWDNVTGISNVQRTEAQADEVVYDLLGRRVVQPQSGHLYLSRSRKVFIQE